MTSKSIRRLHLLLKDRGKQALFLSHSSFPYCYTLGSIQQQSCCQLIPLVKGSNSACPRMGSTPWVSLPQCPQSIISSIRLTVQHTDCHLLPAQGSHAEGITRHQGAVETKRLSLAVEGAPGWKLPPRKERRLFPQWSLFTTDQHKAKSTFATAALILVK